MLLHTASDQKLVGEGENILPREPGHCLWFTHEVKFRKLLCPAEKYNLDDLILKQLEICTPIRLCVEVNYTQPCSKALSIFSFITQNWRWGKLGNLG